MQKTSFNDLRYKTIVICGGSGFYGRNFVEFCLENDLFKKICILSRNEYMQFLARKYFEEKFPEEAKKIRWFIGDVRDKSRLQYAFDGAHYVINAASLKRVEVVAYNIKETVMTNVIGQINVAEACMENKIEKCIYISSDKAKNAVLPYGASKNLAENYTIYANSYSKSTKFSALVYGNVFGSSGSVIETFLKEQSNEFKITDKNMTRFFMPIEEVVKLSLFALANSRGGETYIAPAKSFAIVDIARLVNSSKNIRLVGKRTTEKLHERLVATEELDRIFLDDPYYMVLPEKALWNEGLYKTYADKKAEVKEEMFVSDTSQKFTDEEMLALIKREKERLGL